MVLRGSCKKLRKQNFHFQESADNHGTSLKYVKFVYEFGVSLVRVECLNIKRKIQLDVGLQYRFIWVTERQQVWEVWCCCWWWVSSWENVMRHRGPGDWSLGQCVWAMCAPWSRHKLPSCQQIRKLYCGQCERERDLILSYRVYCVMMKCFLLHHSCAPNPFSEREIHRVTA